MAEGYLVHTTILTNLENESPGQIVFDPEAPRRRQVVQLCEWQYDVLVSHVEDYLGSRYGNRELSRSAYLTLFDYLTERGRPSDVERKRYAVRSARLQDYPEFDGTQNCASVGVDIMYSSERGHAKEVKRDVADVVCRDCPFIKECYNWAIHHEEFGIWGGTTATERWQIRAKNKIKLVDPYVVATYSVGY